MKKSVILCVIALFMPAFLMWLGGHDWELKRDEYLVFAVAEGFLAALATFCFTYQWRVEN